VTLTVFRLGKARYRTTLFSGDGGLYASGRWTPRLMKAMSFAVPATSNGVLASNGVLTSKSTALASRKTRATSMSIEAPSRRAAMTLISASVL
jgi:RES domain-containing protein